MASQPAAMNETPQSAPELLQLYTKLPQRWIDMLRDASNEPLVVDSEALLLDALDAGRLRDRAKDQPLAVVYSIERLVEKLVSRSGGNIIFVAFEEYRRAWSTPVCNIRAIMLRHLQATCGLVVRVFESWSCSEYSDFINDTKPLFVLTGDSFMPAALAAQQQEGAAAASLGMVEQLTLGGILRNLMLGTDLAYLSSLQFDDLTAWVSPPACSATSTHPLKSKQLTVSEPRFAASCCWLLLFSHRVS